MKPGVFLGGGLRAGYIGGGGRCLPSHSKKARLREWFHQLQKDAPMDLWLQVGGGE